MKLTIKTKYNNLTTVQKVPLRGIRGLFLLLTATSTSFAQQANYTLTQPDNVSKTYIARDYIHLKPGYSFSSTGGKVLHLKIDNHLVLPASYQSSGQLPNPDRNLNTGYAVGTIAGGASVSPSGAAVYQIPIEVMPGTGGMQPGISIAYNSQSGNGLLGYGWNLGAVSAITRAGKTIYHDDSTNAPRLSNLDNLMLDGQRLIRTTAVGTNLAANSTYKTEIESYLEITCKTLGSYLGFEVKNKEGWVMEYGSTSDSYIKPKNENTAAYAWLLKKVTDANGNYMTYTYTNDAATGEFRLKQIDYTGNATAGLSPYNKIEFIYETRTDKSKSYIAGKSIEQTVILKKIKCSAYNEVIREYQFNYFHDGFVSKLTEVVEFGQNGTRYNSTIIDWSDSKIGSEYKAPLSVNKEGTFPIYADFNGDGKTDFISFPEKLSSSYTTSDVATLFLAVTNSNGQVSFSKQCTIPLLPYFVKLLVADVNGDGLMDIVRVHHKGYNSSGNDLYRYDYFIFNGTSFIESGGFDVASLDAYVGDFDGDGKHDILAGNNLYKAGATTPTTVTGIVWGTDAAVADFTGGGKSDLLVMHSAGWRLYKFNGSAFSLVNSGSDVFTIVTTVDENHLITDKDLWGDFNGDGKIDILVRSVSPAYILFSTGTGFEKKIMPSAMGGEWFTGDFNKDGKTDVAYASFVGSQVSIYISLFNGETFQTPYEQYPSMYIPSGNWQNGWKYLHFADFDGDGYPEACYAKSNNEFVIKSFNNQQKQFVKTIVNGLNHKTSFAYNPMTNTAYCGVAASSYSFPVSKFQQPLYVVTRMKQEFGIIVNEETFYYKGARSHNQGKGFLGFEEITVTNAAQNRKITTKYGYNATYYNVYPTQQKVTTTSNPPTPISQTDFVNSNYVSFSPKVIFPYVNSQTTTDNLTGIAKTTVYTYSSTDHGNPNKITETQGSLISTTNYTWATTQNSTYKNRVTNQTILRTGNGTSFTELKEFQYDTKARLTKAINFDGTATAVTTTTYSDYDNFGNPKTITTSATDDSPTVTTKSTFDATGRFPVTHTDALLKTSSATYNAKTGAVLTQTDIAGQTTSYQYDNFGRLTQVGTPTGTVSYGLIWDISGNNLYRSSVTTPTAGTQYTWYNAAGLETKRQTPGFSDVIVTANEYNTKGQLTKTYLPNHTGISSYYVATYEYNDPYGRLTKEINDGRETKYAYNGLTTTVTAPDGNTRSTTLNSSGLVASSTDELGNSVTYTYNSLGKPLNIMSNNATTTITYNNRGLQETLKDPNLTNPIKYEYNDYGQLKKQTNARNQVTTYLYDAAGRITTETSPERTLTYQYVPSGNGVGQILSITQDNTTIVRSYTYTNRGQVETVKEKIDGTDYTTSYTYNSYGQMTQKQSPSGLKISYEYNTGYLSALRNATNNNSLIWQTTGYNVWGQVYKSTLGNGLTRESNFDEHYMPTQILLKNGNSVIDRVDYEFNFTTGNLTNRNDVSNSKNETFGYDILNRLTSSQSGVTNNFSITYNPNGNITDKSDVGTYQYGTKPHAVTGITLAPTSQAGAVDAITNTSYNRVSSITRNGAVIQKLNFDYNPDNQRNKMVYSENGVSKKTTYYAGSYEKIVNAGGATEEFDYIYTPEGLSAIAIKTNGNTPVFYYVNTDHLGSIRIITDAGRNIVSKSHYDAWGVQTTTNPNITTRGYTGHEHLPEFGLINMNARMYDPVLGRFLEADPYVANSTFSQDFNRYSYARNNPLVYTDPDGEWIHLVIGAAIGGTVNLIVNWKKIDGNFWQGLGYFGVGALAGALGAGVGAGISSAMAAGGSFGAGFIGSSAAMTATSSFVSGAAIGAGAGFSSGFVTGAGNSWLQGNSFGEGLWDGTKGGLIGGASGALLGGLWGGIDAAIDGRHFWHGGRLTTDVSIPLPPMESSGADNCRYDLFRSNDTYYNGETSSVDILRKNFPDVEKKEYTYRLQDMYTKRNMVMTDLGITPGMSKAEIAQRMANSLQNNNAVNYEFMFRTEGMRVAHAVGVNQVKIWDNGKVWVHFMNPSGAGGYSARNFNKMIDVFSIVKFR